MTQPQTEAQIESQVEAQAEVQAQALSFIVTSYNVRPYLGRCLVSLAACARPGDRVILVDDGSTDGTAEQIEAILAQSGFDAGVALHPILLGTNTIGGVGIAGNTGLHAALSDPACTAVFFVDGDDWLEPEGFRACRHAFETTPADILIGDYGEYDEAEDSYRRPADAALWNRLPAHSGARSGPRSGAQTPPHHTEAAQRLALAMIAVPWRKFYRADFLRAHRLRFPEGKFFFEDNPFHWAVCLAADSIAFHDRVLCQHRINRPGQTMASTGTELAAFFDHYGSIRGSIRAAKTTPPAELDLEVAALVWLLNNMSWHMERLQPAAFWPYAARAARTLAGVPEPIWQAAAAHVTTRVIGAIAEELRRGHVAAVVSVWMQERQTAKIADLRQWVEDLAAGLPRLGADIRAGVGGDLAAGLGAGLTAELRPPLERSAEQVSALYEILRFQALTALPDGTPAPLQIRDDRA